MPVPHSILVTFGDCDHGRGTATPSRDTALDGALAGLRLDGAIFFRAEFTERWAYRSPTPDQLTQILRPGAARLIIFHIVVASAMLLAASERASSTSRLSTRTSTR